MNKFLYLALAVAMLVSCVGGNRGMVGAYSKAAEIDRGIQGLAAE
ncbi:MAG: hypothetical protein ACI4TL_05360 [Candidatus Cryptobacteroides sp.]